MKKNISPSWASSKYLRVAFWRLEAHFTKISKTTNSKPPPVIIRIKRLHHTEQGSEWTTSSLEGNQRKKRFKQITAANTHTENKALTASLLPLTTPTLLWWRTCRPESERCRPIYSSRDLTQSAVRTFRLDDRKKRKEGGEEEGELVHRAGRSQ